MRHSSWTAPYYLVWCGPPSSLVFCLWIEGGKLRVKIYAVVMVTIIYQHTHYLKIHPSSSIGYKIAYDHSCYQGCM